MSVADLHPRGSPPRQGTGEMGHSEEPPKSNANHRQIQRCMPTQKPSLPALIIIHLPPPTHTSNPHQNASPPPIPTPPLPPPHHNRLPTPPPSLGSNPSPSALPASSSPPAATPPRSGRSTPSPGPAHSLSLSPARLTSPGSPRFLLLRLAGEGSGEGKEMRKRRRTSSPRRISPRPWKSPPGAPRFGNL